MERVPTGIPGLDSLIGGGIPKGNSILLEGKTGSYKELLALQFLYSSASKGEPTLFVSFQRKEDDLLEIASVCNWDLKRAMESRALTLFFSEMFNFQQFLSNLEDTIFNANTTRLVFDSASFLEDFVDSEFRYRNSLNDIRKVLDKRGCTSLFLSDSLEDPAAEAVFDGVIRLFFENKQHSLTIPEMHSARVTGHRYPLELREDGLKVHNIPLL